LEEDLEDPKRIGGDKKFERKKFEPK